MCSYNIFGRSSADDSENGAKRPPLRPAVCGHRGASAVAPENTIESFAAAREHGATWLEFDVRPTADQQFIVHHDPITASAVHLGSTSAADLTSDIPLLSTVVDQFVDLTLDVELKTDDTGLDAATYAELAATEMTGLAAQYPHARFLVTSFDADVLTMFAERCPDVATGFLYYRAGKNHSRKAVETANARALEHAVDRGHQAIVPHHLLVTPDMVERANDAGLRVATWTVNSVDDAQRCAQAGVDVVIGDDPRMLVDALNQLNS